MKFDDFGIVITHAEDPGCLGDSCANTARFAVCRGVEKGEFDPKNFDMVKDTTLSLFISEHGFLRHPDAPFGPPRSLVSWRESNASSDQVFPLLLAADQEGLEIADIIRSRLRKTWKVGPGKLASPALMALAFENYKLLKIFTDAQTLIFKFPWRWSDDNRMKGKLWKFERSDGSSADYLNYAAAIIFLRRKRIYVKFNRSKTLEMITAYFEPEPESDWIVDAFRWAL